MQVKIRFQIRIDDLVIGPGKVTLLEGVANTGSISGAAKASGMTFRRAWQLLETLRTGLGKDVLETQVGGKTGGGAQVTEFGHILIHHYRKAEKSALDSAQPLLEIIAHQKNPETPCPPGKKIKTETTGDQTNQAQWKGETPSQTHHG